MYSIKDTDPKKTVEILLNGENVWTNPNFSVGIRKRDGAVIDLAKGSSYGEVRIPQLRSLGVDNRYGIYIGECKYSNPTVYNSIVNYMFGLPIKRHTAGELVLKDATKGITFDNIEFVKNANGKTLVHDFSKYDHMIGSKRIYNLKKKKSPIKQAKKNSPLEKQHTKTNHDPMKKEIVYENVPFIMSVSSLYFVTTDGKRFSTSQVDDANTHQDNVYKAMNLASIIVESNAGYALAEKVYHETLGDSSRPYKNFYDAYKSRNDKLKEVSGYKIMIDVEKYDLSNVGDIAHGLKEAVFTTYDEAKAIAKVLNSINTQYNILLDLITKPNA